MQHHDRLPLLRGFAAGMVGLGAGVLLAAGLLPASPAVAEPPAWAGWAWWVLPVLLVWLAVLAISAFSGTSRAAIAFRLSCALLAMLTAGPAWWSIEYAEAALRGGVPAVGPALFAIGFPAVCAGAAALAAVGPIVWPLHQPDLRWRPRRSVAGVAVSAFVVGAAVVGLAWWVGSGSVTATTASTAESQAVPRNAGAVHWTWKPAPGRPVHDVVAAGPGVVVRVNDGIVALDGRTGKERWHFRWRGANASELVASPDGRRVVVRFASTQPRVVGVRVVGFDAMTGVVGFDDILDLAASDDPRLLLTDHVLVVDHEDAYVGRDARTGKQLWTYTKPGRCWRIGDADAPVPAHDAVLLRQPCGPAQSSRRDVVLTGGLLALDDRTGKVRWRLGRTVPALGSQYVWADVAGHVTWVGRDATDTDTRWSYTLAAKDGTVLAERRPRSGAVADVSADLSPVCDRHEPGELYEALALDTAATGARLSRSWICLTGKALIGLDAPRDAGPADRGTVTVLPRAGGPKRTFEIDAGDGLVLAPGAVVAWEQAAVVGLR